MYAKSLISMLLLSVISVSQASEGVYIGLNIGVTSYDSITEDLVIPGDGSLFSPSIDDENASYSITLGYQFNPYFSLQGGFTDLGILYLYADSDGSGSRYDPGNVTLKVKMEGLFFDAKGQLPLNEKFDLYGRLGILSWRDDVSLLNRTINENIGSHNNDDVFYGAGISLNLNSSAMLNVEYTLYELDNLDVDVISLGLQFGF